MSEGFAVLAPDLRIRWANATFARWAGPDLQGRNFFDALGAPQILGPEFAPFDRAPPAKTTHTRLGRGGTQYFDLAVTPASDDAGRVAHYITMLPPTDIVGLVCP